MRKEDAARQMILDDCIDSLDIFCRCSKSLRAVYMLGGLSYFALVIDGAIKWCNKANIPLQCKGSPLLEKLRAKTKLFSGDTTISFQDQMVLYDEIISIEKQYYIDLQRQSGKWCPKFLIPDMGRFSIGNHCVGNTIEFAYELSPFNPEKKPFAVAAKSREGHSSIPYLFSYELGGNIQSIIQALSGQSYVLNYFPDESISLSEKEVRIGNISALKKAYAIQISNICCRLNFILELVLSLCADNRLFPFRMAYITYYHLREDLLNLKLNQVHYHLQYDSRELRNVMAHYNLFRRLDDSDVNTSVIGYGVFEKLVSASYEQVSKSLFDEMRKTRDALERYIKI